MATAAPAKNKSIAFIRPAALPLANQVLPGVLEKAFPEYNLEILDVSAIFKAQPVALIKNMLAMLLEYGPKLAAGYTTPREAFYTTTYLYTKIAQLVRERISPDRYAFSFQMQSLFDASTGRVPHFVYTDHTHLARLTYPGFDQHKLRSPKWIEMERGIYQHAALNFTWSSNISRSIVEQYQLPAEKVVFAGVGSNFETGALDNDDYRNQNILFVGMDWERKGGPNLLCAFEKVLKKHPQAHLTIVGSSPETHLPNCEIVGKVPVETMGQYFRKASIFCLPTKMEPFGVAFIEALYYKLPIVATNLGAIPDFVKPGETGYLVESGDVEGLARALDQLLSDPNQSRTFGQKGFALANANYSWEGVADKLSRAIRKVVQDDQR